jgi:FMN phosphatase YigB (HAD superfamily)
VIGVEEVGLRNKINRDAYERMLALLGARGPECIMVEDSARNLQPASTLGLTTILVDPLPGEVAQHAPEVDYVVGNVLEVGRVVEYIQTCQV